MFEEIINNDYVIKTLKPILKNYQAYLVGGYVRDLFFNEQNPDKDLIIENCNISQISQEIADKIGGYFVPLDTENDIYRVIFKDKINYIDITKPIENNLEKDVKRRDLTINSILYDLNNDKFIDLTGGIEDIKNKRIKCINNQNFKDDTLRLLRVFRFYAKFGFEIDNQIINYIKENHSDIKLPAKERIMNEFIKIFDGKYTDKALLLMDECNILEDILPIFKEVKKIPPNSHHHLDLFHHSVETVRQIQNLYDNSNEEIKEHFTNNKFGICNRFAYLKLATFCHDIGKPSTWTIEEGTNRHRFIKHDLIGGELIVPVLKDLKFSKKQIEYVQLIIKNHIYPSSIISQEGLTEKAENRFFRKLNEYVPDIILIAKADRLSALGSDITEEIVQNNINGLNTLLNKYFKQKESLTSLPKLLNGNEIMQILNIKQSPKLGKIIKDLEEAQISGEINNKEEAIEYIKQYN